MIKLLKKMVKNDSIKNQPVVQYDDIEEGFFVGWCPSYINEVAIFIEGVKVAEGLCDQVREDVKEILGIEAKGFRILFDGNAIEYSWLFRDQLSISVVATDNENIRSDGTVTPKQLVEQVLFYNQKSISELKSIIEKSLLWNEEYYCSQLKIDRVIATDKIKDYVLFGAKLRKDPCIHFSTNYYLTTIKNGDEIKETPLIHYLHFGEQNGFKVNPYFDPISYKNSNKDLSDWKHSLLAHFVLHGDKEGRKYNDIHTETVITKEVITYVEKEFPFSQKVDFEESMGFCEYVIWGKKYAIIVGWYISNGELTEVALSLNNSPYMLAENAKVIPLHRPDVKKAFPNKNVKDFSGFMALVEINNGASIAADESLSVHLVDEKGSISVQSQMIYLADDNKNINCSRILNNWNPELPEHQTLAANVILPMIHELYPVDNSVASKRYNYGAVNEHPVATVIIPLYGRFDFMRYQISNFARYNGMNNIEVIYVVDDPSIEGRVLKLAVELHKIFNFNFSVVSLESNVGFGRANNIGVEYATAENLILLNSDVLPKDGDWANKLIGYLNNLPNAGLVGARLLFEDESIQHDGMSPMLLEQYPGLIFNDHPMKGWPVSLSHNALEAAECPLVTAACVAVKKSFFEQLGGFDPAYVLGDFEDSDLCLRALDKGKTNYICRDITLNHLERLSQNLVEAGDWKHKLTLLNANTYNQRWSQNLQILFPNALKELNNA
jgi:O-antigen biosynthesis protein